MGKPEDAAVRRLVDAAPPEAEAARRRAWAVASEGFAEAGRGTGRRGRSGAARLLRPAAVLAAAAVVLALALTPPGEAVADWLRDVVTVSEPAPATDKGPLARAPTGRLLLSDGERLRAVQPDGLERFLGEYRDGTWSPQGRFIAAWSGRELAALRPDGPLVWSITAPAPVTHARWSPEGFHVAYLAGRSLRVVAGNGLRDRLFRAAVRPVAPAFRPRASRTLAWIGPRGRVVAADLFTGAVVARSGPRLGRGATALAWSGDGRVLAVARGGATRLWDVRSGRVRTVRLDGTVRALAGAPRGRRFAVVLHDRRRGVGEVALLGRAPATLVRVRGRLRDVAFSPGGTRLLATWPRRRMWVVLDPRRRTVEFAAPAGGRAGRIAGWAADLPRGR